jgi:hypothetical protein
MSVAQMIDQAREIPLGTILQSIGLTPRREGTTTRYKSDQFNIVVSPNNLWFDNAAAVGGRGPIDLALHLKCKANPRLASPHHLREALDWLTKSNLPSASLPSTRIQPKPSQFKPTFQDQAANLAIRDDARWPMARHYLTRTRSLPGDLVDQLYASGDLYASFSRHFPAGTGVCFLHRNLEGEIRGGTVRNVDSAPASCFSLGEKAGAWFTLGDPHTATQMAVVESPIDAISFAKLRQPVDTVILSMSCANVFRSVLAATHERRWTLAVAFDNDGAGSAGWNRCLENQHQLYPHDPLPTRVTPRMKDWNKDLCAAPRRTHRRGL